MTTQMQALYLSDFLVSNRQTLNTLCLFYDKLFIHDYFGLFGGLYEKSSYESMDRNDPKSIDFLWKTAAGLDEESQAYFRSAHENALDAYILKGVAQAFRFGPGVFSPSFVIKYAKQYSKFIRQNYPLISHGVLAMCESSHNPFHPAHNPTKDVNDSSFDLRRSQMESLQALEAAKNHNKLACMHDQERFKLPLVSDSPEDTLRWDRSKDLLTTALILTAVPARVPAIADVPAETILEAREKLNSTLPVFRTAMLKAAWEIGSAARGSTMEEVKSLGRLYYETQITPAVEEIEHQIESEQRKLKQKLFTRGLDQAVLVAKALDPTDHFSKWELLGSGLKSLLDMEESKQNKVEIKSPYEYLIQLPLALKS